MTTIQKNAVAAVISLFQEDLIDESDVLDLFAKILKEEPDLMEILSKESA